MSNEGLIQLARTVAAEPATDREAAGILEALAHQLEQAEYEQAKLKTLIALCTPALDEVSYRFQVRAEEWFAVRGDNSPAPGMVQREPDEQFADL